MSKNLALNYLFFHETNKDYMFVILLIKKGQIREFIWLIIYLLYSPSNSLQFGEIKNEGLEVVKTPPPPSLKNFQIR